MERWGLTTKKSPFFLPNLRRLIKGEQRTTSKKVGFCERRRDQKSRRERSHFEREKTLPRVSPLLFLCFGTREEAR